MACCLYSSQRERSTTKKTETVYQTRTTLMNSRVETLFGVRLTMSSSTASRNEMMMTRTFTSHASHDRSLNLLPIPALGFAFCSALACLSSVLPITNYSLLLSRHLRDHREHRQIQRNHNAAHYNTRKTIIMGSSRVSRFLVAAS